MSNVLRKSAFGFMVVAAAVVLFAVLATTALAAYTHTVTLKQGSSGSQVMALQQALGITADGAFGPMTKAAVMSYQASKGLTADGVVGPMTGASLAASGSVSTGGSSSSALCPNGMTLASNCTSAAGSSSTGSTMGTDDGDLTDFNEVSTSDSAIEEGETSEVFGFEFEVEGDVSIDRIDFYMEVVDDATASDNPDDYFQSAILMVDGEEVATLDVDDFSDEDTSVVADGGDTNDEYRLRFSSLDWVLEDGDQPEVTLAFEANSSIDTADLAGDWTVELETDSVRFVDGRGFSDEEGAALTETFGSDEEETAELNVSTSSEDPEATILEVSDEDETEEVAVFVFELEEENGVDVTVNDLRVDITTGASTGTTDEAAVITDAYLYNGSTLLGSESVATGGQTTFEDIDLQVDANDTVELTVKLTFADADDYTAGTDVAVTLTGNTTYLSDVEDANGNDEGDMTLSGSATSETHSLREEGIMVTFDDSSYVKTTSDTTGINETVEFTLEFDITAFGDDMWIDKTCIDNASPATNHTTDVVVSLDNDTDGSSTSCTDFDSTGDEGTHGFEVEEGQTEHFTVTVLGNGGEAASAGSSVTFTARLEAIGYNVGTDAAGDLQYAFDLADYKSAAVTVFDR